MESNHDFRQNANNEMSDENNSQSSQASTISRWSEKIYIKNTRYHEINQEPN